MNTATPALAGGIAGGNRPSRHGRLAGVVFTACSAALLVVACGDAGNGGKSERAPGETPVALKVIGCDVASRDDVARNQILTIRFSAALSKASLKPEVLSRAINIGIVTPSGRVPAKGILYHPIVKGKEQRDRLAFDPTRTPRAAILLCADNPFGYDPLTTYTIDIPTPATSTKFLTGTDGRPIIEPYDAFFNTTDKYVRESPIVQPRYIGTDGQGTLGFNPVRKLNGEVPYNARVDVVFDSAMDPASFEIGNTVSVKNDTLSTLQGATVLVPGTFSPDACGKAYTFSPSFSFGGGGYDISVILSTGLKDLAGNPLANPQTIRFRTEVKAGVPTTQIINELFDNNLKMDAVNTTADWNGATLGALTGGSVTTTVVAVQLQVSQYPGGLRTRVRDHPFANQGSGGVGHDQWIYLQSELGPASAITAIGWGPSSNALFASYHSAVALVLGHTQGDSLGTTMDNNFDVGIPVKVTDIPYTIPQRATIDPPCNNDSCAVGYWPMPTFSGFFEYNGKNNLIVDVDAALGTNYQITRIFFGPVGFPNRHCFGATGSAAATLTETAVTDMNFTKKRRTTIGQSKFYDSGVVNPNYSTPILTPSSQTGGTTAQIEFEGADGILFPIPGNPNNVIPDPTTFTGFVTNIDQLDGKRFVRFRITFVANVNTGQVPIIKSLGLPYIF
jgi:hypothetical protein